MNSDELSTAGAAAQAVQKVQCQYSPSLPLDGSLDHLCSRS